MFKKILLAYNGTPEGKSALLACEEIAEFTEVETHLLAVASNIPMLAPMVEDGQVVETLLTAERKHMEEALEEGVQQLRRDGFYATGHLKVGEPVEEISRLAKELAVDLIIVGHKKKTSLKSRWWRGSGSVGKLLLDHAHCSVFIALTER
jgi:nucleotide-binding universal stress UspA family protein